MSNRNKGNINRRIRILRKEYDGSITTLGNNSSMDNNNSGTTKVRREVIVKTNEQKIEELTNEGMLADMELDFTIFKLSRVWNSYDYIWSRWIVSN